jgi:hypothetical protein
VGWAQVTAMAPVVHPARIRMAMLESGESREARVRAALPAPRSCPREGGSGALGAIGLLPGCCRRLPHAPALPGVRTRLALGAALTVRALGGVELLDRVVEADADGGEAHLALQAGHQPAVEAAGTLGAHHGQYCTQHSAVLHALGRGLPLDLGDSDSDSGWRSLVGGGGWWCCVPGWASHHNTMKTAEVWAAILQFAKSPWTRGL